MSKVKTVSLINSLIMNVYEAGWRTDCYSIINSVAYYGSILFGILHGKKLKASLFTVIAAVLLERELAGYLCSAILYVENGFVQTGKANAVVAYAFIPLLGFLVSKILKKSYKIIWDIMMVPPLVMFIGARIACTVAGCCRGYACDWGVYNVKVEDYLFPIQLMQALATLLILLYVLWREKKNNYIPDGRNVPIILISYGISRFFLEFLQDNEKVFLECSTTSFHCILMIIVGCITLAIIRKSENTYNAAPKHKKEQPKW